jgi:uncharacterized protein (TIGR00304 family)
MKGSELLSVGFILVFIGITLIVIGMLYEAVKSKEVEGRGAGIVLIGPFPIIFGTDIESIKAVIILTIVLILLVFFLFLRWSH